MDTDNELNLLTNIDNNYETSSTNNTRNDTFFQLYVAKNTRDTFEFIVLNDPTFKNKNINKNQNELTDSDQEQLNSLVQNECIIVDQNEPKKTAFIVLNGDDTICGPLFALNRNEQIQTVFDLDDMSIYHYVDKYIDEINRIDSSLFPRLEDKTVSNVVQDWSTDMSIADISSSTNDLNSEIFVSPNNKIETHTWDNQIKQKIPQTNKHYTSNVISSLIQDSGINPNNSNHTSEKVTTTYQEQTQILSHVIREPEHHMLQYNETFISSNTDNNYQSNTVQLNESNRFTQADQISVDTSSSILTHLSTTTGVPQIVLPQTSTQYSCKKPEIVTEPKQDWHPRYPKDLIPKPKNKVNKNPKVNPKYQRKTNKHINKKEQRKFIGLLQGVGGQRSHIQVPSRYIQPIYLAIAVRTINNHYHSSKVIVQEKTKVNKDLCNHENYPNYLEFDECDQKHYFDLNTRNVYMKITLKEHRQQLKKVPIYMFNLYQNQRLTKDMIEREQLDKCKLAFWLCIKENETYKPISPESLSCIITEKKKKSNSSRSITLGKK
ncbi:unnamed protein product [Rotaria sordida]|uniref:Uncharacterized protein n=1 Tax=Rotaria sordida TaxID=392033 RepID=A0A814CT18_9BILA|nr:unnamed protein product [Rotaria sordida]